MPIATSSDRWHVGWQKKGQTIIAAVAEAHGCIVVTDNSRAVTACH